jgi:peptidoglycan/LPS O-acetylase OafA/YrhL
LNEVTTRQPFTAFGILGYPLVGLSAAGTLFATLGSKGALMRNPALIYLGKISYGLYVYHMFAMWTAERIFGPPHGFARFSVYLGASLAITMALSALSYRFLESPFLRLKSRFTYVGSRPV